MFLIDIRLKCVKKLFCKNCGTLKSVRDCYENQEMCNKAVHNYLMHQNLFLNVLWPKKCVKKLSILILLQYNLFLNARRLTKMCDKAFNDFFPSFFIFLIEIKLRKCAKLQRTLFFQWVTAETKRWCSYGLTTWPNSC